MGIKSDTIYEKGNMGTPGPHFREMNTGLCEHGHVHLPCSEGLRLIFINITILTYRLEIPIDI